MSRLRRCVSAARGRERLGQWVAALAFAAVFAFPLPSLADPTETKPGAAASDPDYAAGKQALDRKDWGEAARRFGQAALRDPDNADSRTTSASPIASSVSSTKHSSITGAPSS